MSEKLEHGRPPATHLPTLRTDELAPARGGRELSKRPLWHMVPRLTSYAVAIFIVWVILTVMFPPVFTRSSERAVVDGPVNLVTTPVEGVVAGQHVAVGTSFAPGDTLMSVQNPNIDRALLVELTGKKLDTQQRYDAAKAKLEGDQSRLAATDQETKKYQAAAQAEHAAKIRGIEARMAVAREQVDQQEDVVNRNQAMQWAGAVSEAYTNASRYQLSILSNSKEAIRAELDNALSSSQAAKGKVYLSSTDGAVSTLAQRHDELTAEITQLQAELTQLEQYGKSVDTLIATEEQRLQRMSNLDIKAYDTGMVQDVLAPPGTRVAAGATLLRSTNCAQPRVVAVFPRSLSNDMLPGAKVTVRVDGVGAPMSGKVAEILPRAPDGEQARYFVPFPPIEKNEIYLIAKLDKPLPAPPQQGAATSADRCAMGRWAKVSLDQPWWGHMRTLI
ncbi:HlyD family efflux transporter periplasmic adaptor subunit [Cupriavidus sp. CV2]|uniref:HlyD family secretion protein n=1 Tax=Cupriavidus ulmosensis TaxID=3065913 RepID=UPI00296AC5C3|nr:HlyD family efflux transporter periplasmic adaptor subunit [Cupriavidus sp. CV2]MDW3687796.1 HlyD family efflux transporter periplasmic adaptor subunit [Cupriavidus sp. CV2]